MSHLVDADQVRHLMAHSIHGVVRLVAMEGPVARIVGHEFNGAHLAHGDVGGNLGDKAPRWAT